MSDKKVGNISHYYDQIGVAVIDLVGTLEVGDKIRISGSNEFEQEVTSIQADHNQIEKASKGESVGIKLSESAKKGDEVFKI